MDTYIDDFNSMDPDKWPMVVPASVTSGRLSLAAPGGSIYLADYDGTTGFVQCAVCDRKVVAASGESIYGDDPRLCEHLTGVRIHFGPGEAV